MMTNYVKNYKKKDITKAYDLLELKDNGRIDEDGDYLDDEREKLTISVYMRGIEVQRKIDNGSLDVLQVDYYNKLIPIIHHLISCGVKKDIIYPSDFICVGVNGERWCVRRDIFLATYEEVQ